MAKKKSKKSMSQSASPSILESLGLRHISQVFQNERLHLGLNEEVLSMDNENEGLTLLADLDKKNDMLSNDGFSRDKRKFLLRYPQYKGLWQWQQKLRFGYAYACKLPDYDPVANTNLKRIMDQIN